MKNRKLTIAIVAVVAIAALTALGDSALAQEYTPDKGQRGRTAETLFALRGSTLPAAGALRRYPLSLGAVRRQRPDREHAPTGNCHPFRNG